MRNVSINALIIICLFIIYARIYRKRKRKPPLYLHYSIIIFYDKIKY